MVVNKKDVIKLSMFSMFIVFIALSFFGFQTNKVYAGIDCSVANTDDCNCDGTCETDTSSDPNNCGACGIKCGGNVCLNGSCVPVTGGLVPCGRFFDDPSTLWNEQQPCNLCHVVPLIDNVINYLVPLIGLITVLFITIGGLMSVTSLGGSSGLTTAKLAISKSTLGFVFVLVAWVIVNLFMTVFGFIDPMGDGSWRKVDCNILVGPLIPSHCGDGIVTSPNDDGINEQCDPKETYYNYLNRTGGTKEQWVESIYRCDPVNCSLECAADPLVGSVGEGCYLDLHGTPAIKENDECQKGRYVCDSGTNTVMCTDTFTDTNYKIGGQACSSTGVYDYCCESASTELQDGKIDEVPFKIVKASVADLQAGATGWMGWSGPGCLPNCANLGTGLWGGALPNGGTGGWAAGTGFRCDNVCKNMGKVCVGVGLTDPQIDSCIYIQHDEGSNPGGCNNGPVGAGAGAISMSLPANQASTNCNAWFAMFYYSNKNGSGAHWSTGYDKYVYHCEKYDPGSYWETYSSATYNFADVPIGSEGVCKPDPPDTCEFHGFDLIETACYCL